MTGIGALCDHRSGACTFRVWAPFRRSVDVKILGPRAVSVPMTQDARGYWQVSLSGLEAGTRYFYRLDDERDRPDPASRHQPEGVHGPSAVVDHGSFRWTDNAWRGLPLAEYVVYELHIGTFTPEGTFDAAIPRISELQQLGITAMELMPVAQFPGGRNWGYDGTYPFAVQHSYGGPEGLKRLIDACHGQGMAVVLDVVYNHLGPEGNYLGEYGPYFTDRYRTPWGQAINYDGAYANEVRNYVIGNALSWIRDYHVDALRVDAVHGIFDFGARHILQDIGDAVHGAGEETGRSAYVIPESDLNDARLIRPREVGGYGLDAQWNDDFHHCIRTLLTGERTGYYQDFGRLEDLAKAFREGFVYSGQYSPYRKRDHGGPSTDRPAYQFVVFSQNHDQVGNRMLGDRLSAQASFEAQKLAAACVILSP
jgi:maltooligosyltrehalose trehalohydrolase